MIVLAIVNQKGGSGKTSVTVNLAHELTARGKSVVAIDADPQGTLTTWMLGSKQRRRGTAEVLGHGGGKPEQVKDYFIYAPAFGGCAVLPATYDSLSDVEHEIHRDRERQLGLATAVATLDQAGRTDYVLIDCPPNLRALTSAALYASSHVLTTFDSSPLALDAFLPLYRAIEQGSQFRYTEIIGAIFTRYRANQIQSRESMNALKAMSSFPLYLTVREATDVGNSFMSNWPTSKYNSDSVAALDFQTAAAKIDELLFGEPSQPKAAEEVLQ